MMFAEMGIKELSKHVDSLIIIPNEQLAKVMPKNATLMQAFSAAMMCCAILSPVFPI